MKNEGKEFKSSIEKIEEFIVECDSYGFSQPPAFRAVGMLYEIKSLLNHIPDAGKEGKSMRQICNDMGNNP